MESILDSDLPKCHQTVTGRVNINTRFFLCICRPTHRVDVQRCLGGWCLSNIYVNSRTQGYPAGQCFVKRCYFSWHQRFGFSMYHVDQGNKPNPDLKLELWTQHDSGNLLGPWRIHSKPVADIVLCEKYTLFEVITVQPTWPMCATVTGKTLTVYVTLPFFSCSLCSSNTGCSWTLNLNHQHQ